MSNLYMIEASQTQTYIGLCTNHVWDFRFCHADSRPFLSSRKNIFPRGEKCQILCGVDKNNHRDHVNYDLYENKPH